MIFPPACTIVSNNYLALARVLADSYRGFHPGARVIVCIADRPAVEINYDNLPFEIVFAHELGIPAFANLAFRYDIVEFNTSLKPCFLAYLRDVLGFDRAFYLDPDILILDRLDELIDSLDRHSAVLTPHITQGLPDDGYRPSERVLLLSGVYNLGFLGIKLDETTATFIQWWRDRLLRFCLHDIHNGLFLDQRWMDFAPAFLPSIEVQRSAAFNIAYWNLPQRNLRLTGDVWMVDDVRAGFFHFSGIVFERLDAVSKYQSRISSSTHPEVIPLLEEYRARVFESGHEQLRTIAYGFGSFSSSSRPVPDVFRRALRQVDPMGLRWEDPFDDQGGSSFAAWMVEPLEFASGTLNRAALFLWESRADLMRRFPSVWSDDLEAYSDWLAASDETQRDGLPTEFLPPRRARSHRHLPRDDRPVVAPLDPGFSHPATGLDAIDLSLPGAAVSWLNEEVAARESWPVLTRLALRLYELRSDVQAAFPDPLNADQTGFASWFVFSAGAEYGLHESLLRPTIRSFPPRRRLPLQLQRLRTRLARSRRPILPASGSHIESQRVESNSGRDHISPSTKRRAAVASPHSRSPTERAVNLAGYFESPSGVGQIVRGTSAALDHARIPLARVPLDADWWARVVNGRISQPAGAPFEITLLHVNAAETPNVLRLLPVSAVASSFMIGYWFWELSHFPLAFANRFHHLNEVWAPSLFCKASFEALSTIPVVYMPPHVPAPPPGAPRRFEFGLDDRVFYYLVTFDVFSVSERKNPFGVIEAFRKLHRGETGLIMRINQAAHDPDLVRGLREASRGLNVAIFDEIMSRERFDGLFACADAFISLHRSEGLGLPPIEAMYLRKPVIATAYGGVTDFLDESTGFPVRYDLVSLDRDYPPYPSGAVWAQPDIGAAADSMAQILSDPGEAAIRAEKAFARVTSLYGVQAAAGRFTAEIDRILRDLGGQENRGRATSRSAEQM